MPTNLDHAEAALESLTPSDLENLRPARLEQFAALARHWADQAEKRRQLVLASNEAAKANTERRRANGPAYLIRNSQHQVIATVANLTEAERYVGLAIRNPDRRARLEAYGVVACGCLTVEDQARQPTAGILADLGSGARAE